MRVFLLADPGVIHTRDVYGHELMEAFDTKETIRACYEYLQTKRKDLPGVQVEIASGAAEVIAGTDETDIVVAAQNVIYRTIAGSGLRGYYRSTRFPGSERCKGLAITLLKSLSDYSDLYYHGVYNEQVDAHLDLSAIVKVRALAALIEVGYIETERRCNQNCTGRALALGLLRHLNACQLSSCRQDDRQPINLMEENKP